MLQKESKIYIAGSSGMVGSSIVKYLKRNNYNNLIFKSHSELNLLNMSDVNSFFKNNQPEYVFLCAAKVGGILDNKNHKADFIFQNLQIQNNIIHQSYLHGVKKLIFIASTSIYPKDLNEVRESDLMKGELDYSNESYAIAKIAGLKMCEAYNIQYNTNFISLVPTNLYGENDRFDLEKAHVVPALIRKFHLARLLMEKRYEEILRDLKIKNLEEAENYLNQFGINNNSLIIWGSGNAKREFLHVDDLTEACIFTMNNINFKDLYKPSDLEIKNTHINISPSCNTSIGELAFIVKDVVGYSGNVFFDKTKPEGALNRLTDCSKIHSLGWHHKISLADGIKKLYNWYLKKNKEEK
ncbi:GDP-L-fucose synthase [Campylobacter coli]|uniref:GDP-L-fucose synthase family protein n=1 Tax=Campylobacter coli TaxID=195 RepID=UPI0006B599C6|nr:GDP-L-fucose synthase [Campylobacter coli]EAI4284985.1 GDP-L-fucose synthase [Campylobacter coli]EAJ8132257.1 GDP-L-fucose synthase [Campylobacter coli]EAK7552917.1 GDP-L-fucose synthase [Campylobacter coli]EAK7554185.1 GDP-L-fucose synthase [Campylobacter coli]ECL2349245.1 GDP-L-fucose synthase [Campylobacter coli]